MRERRDGLGIDYVLPRESHKSFLGPTVPITPNMSLFQPVLALLYAPFGIAFSLFKKSSALGPVVS